MAQSEQERSDCERLNGNVRTGVGSVGSVRKSPNEPALAGEEGAGIAPDQAGTVRALPRKRAPTQLQTDQNAHQGPSKFRCKCAHLPGHFRALPVQLLLREADSEKLEFPEIRDFVIFRPIDRQSVALYVRTQR